MTDAVTQPSRDEFLALARDHTVVPVWREVLADLETPVSAFVKLVGSAPSDPAGFLLESVEHAERWGRFSFLGRDPALTLVVRGRAGRVRRRGAAGHPVRPGRARRGRSAARMLPGAADRRELPPFHGGVVGYLGYDVVREIERLPAVPPDDPGLPDAVLSLTGHVTAFDHFRQRLYLIENVFLARRDDDRRRPRTTTRSRGSTRASTSWRGRCRTCRRRRRSRPMSSCRPCTSTMGGDRCTDDAVEAAREYILAGDIFQVVLAQRFDLDGSRRRRSTCTGCCAR